MTLGLPRWAPHSNGPVLRGPWHSPCQLPSQWETTTEKKNTVCGDLDRIKVSFNVGLIRAAVELQGERGGLGEVKGVGDLGEVKGGGVGGSG